MIDSATIKVKAGDGGNGLISFRREKYIPKGGPWGGDGSDGASVYVQVDASLNTLNYYHRQRVYKAKDGRDGMKKLMTPKDGVDMTLKVPLGTLIFDEKHKLIKDCTDPDETFLLIKGGRGGLGNWHFKSSTNRTPWQATDGEKKPYQTFILELKLLADIGIIGLPSSGKSTLINVLTNANAKTAAYPFTTLEPNLGILRIEDFIPQHEDVFVMADIPGLIEGASEGKGLGHNFLKHIERTKLLIHMIDISDELSKPFEAAHSRYQVIQNELALWEKSLLDKPQVIVINKIDIPEVQDASEEIAAGFKKLGLRTIFISATSRLGLKELITEILKVKKESVPQKDKFHEKVLPVITPDTLSNRRMISKTPKEAPHEYD